MGIDLEIIELFCADQAPVTAVPVPRLCDERLRKWYDEHFDDVVMVYDHVHALLCRCKFPEHTMHLDDVSLFRNLCKYIYVTS